MGQVRDSELVFAADPDILLPSGGTSTNAPIVAYDLRAQRALWQLDASSTARRSPPAPSSFGRRRRLPRARPPRWRRALAALRVRGRRRLGLGQYRARRHRQYRLRHHRRGHRSSPPRCAVRARSSLRSRPSRLLPMIASPASAGFTRCGSGTRVAVRRFRSTPRPRVIPRCTFCPTAASPSSSTAATTRASWATRPTARAPSP